MTRALVVIALLAAGCAPTVRTYQVEVSDTQRCLTFEPQAEQCARLRVPTLTLTIRIEDRPDGRALIYGRSDATNERVYQARVPRPGRYEVEEAETSTNNQTGCVTTSTTLLVLNVDDKGLDGGEEVRTDEAKKCNDLNQRRITRFLREWVGSRVDDGSTLPL